MSGHWLDDEFDLLCGCDTAESDGSCPACGELCDGDGCECPETCPIPARGTSR